MRTPLGRSPAIVFALCWLGLMADGYDLYVYGATLPGFLGQEPWNVTPAVAGMVGSLALVGMLVGSLLAGTFTDRLGRRRLLISSLLVFSLAMLACSMAPDFTVFAICRFIACLGVGGLLPTAVAMTNEFASPRRKSITLGLVLTAPPIGSLIASAVALNLVADHGVRPVYAIGALSLLMVPLAYFALPESPAFLRAVGRTAEATAISSRYGLEAPPATIPGTGDTPNNRHPVIAMLRGTSPAATMGMWAICLLSLLTMFGLTTWLPKLMGDAGFATGSAISFLFTYSVGAIIGTVFAALIVQRTAPKVMVIVGFLAATAALVTASQAQSTALLTVAILVAGFGGMGTQNMINDHIAQYYPAGVRATGLGWALSVGRVGAILGPTYGAWAVSTGGGIEFAALAFAVPALLGAVISMLLPRHARTASPTTATAPTPLEAKS